MLHYIRLKNFYSVWEELELDLVVGSQVSDDAERFGPIHKGNCDLAPKVIGIYGPNASGKSTLLRGISFISWFFQHSFATVPDTPLYCQPFNTNEGFKTPIEIEIGFCAPTDLSKPESERCKYAYHLKLDATSGQTRKILAEALYFWPPGTTKRRRVFLREGDNLVSHPKSFYATGFVAPLENILRPNVSLISTLVQLGHKPSIWLRDTLGTNITTNIYVQKFDLADGQVAQAYAQSESALSALNREIQRLDLGIEKVVLNEVKNAQGQWTARFLHAGLANPLNSMQESNGTRQFVRIFPLISAALEKGGIAVIDELDSSIHPLILPEIIGWFYDQKRNQHGAQLWFTCQNAYLLNELAKEQILFCEKDAKGHTTAFSLRDVKSVRRIDNYAKKYLGGAYGAVPHVG